MTTVDDRLLARFTASTRRQEEARRFLAWQGGVAPRREKRALEQIVLALEDIERTLAERAGASPSPCPPGRPRTG